MNKEQQNQMNRWSWITIIALSVFAVFWLIYGSITRANAATVQPPTPPEDDQPAHYGVLLESIYDPNYVYAVSYAFGGISLWEEGYAKYFSYSLYDVQYLDVKASYDGGQTYPYTIYLTKPNITNYKVIYGDICAAYAGYDKIQISSDNTVSSSAIEATTIDNQPSYPNKLYFDAYINITENNGITSTHATFCFMSKGEIHVSQSYNSKEHFDVWNNSDESKLYYYDSDNGTWRLVGEGNGLSTHTYKLTAFGVNNNIHIDSINVYLRGAFTFNHFSYYFNGDLTDTSTGFINNGIKINACKFANEVDDYVPTPTPTASPTPTPELEPVISFIIKQKNDYYLYDVFGSFLESSIQPLTINGSSNNALSSAMSTYNLSNDFCYSVFYTFGNYTGNRALLYFGSNGISSVVRYSLGTSLVSSDYQFLRDNYVSSEYSDFGFSSSLNLAYIKVTDGGGWGISLVSSRNIPNLNLVNAVDSYSYNNESNLFNYSSTATNNQLYIAYRYGLSGAVTITPTPDPNATPTPTVAPTPTDLPHVIVVVPTGTPAPTPTAMGNLGDITLPGDGSGNEQGGNSGDLQVGTTKSIIGAGIDYIRNHISNGLLASAFSFVPSDLQFLVWFLVFMLILLAVIRLIIHFGG